jgi:hypothetical protein
MREGRALRGERELLIRAEGLEPAPSPIAGTTEIE